eukprot:585718-Rhodomonas_salina.1
MVRKVCFRRYALLGRVWSMSRISIPSANTSCPCVESESFFIALALASSRSCSRSRWRTLILECEQSGAPHRQRVLLHPFRVLPLQLASSPRHLQAALLL